MKPKVWIPGGTDPEDSTLTPRKDSIGSAGSL